MTANIFNIQKFSIHDGPGIRTVIFFKGCPLKCLWCSNPESQSVYMQLLWNSEKCIRCHKCESSCPTDSIYFDNDYFTFKHNACVKCLHCVKQCPVKAIEYSGQEKTLDDIMTEIRKDIDFYEESGGGVTLSGGEVLLWHDFAASLLLQLKKEGISSALETTGYSTEHTFQKVVGHTDLLLFDMKHHDEKKHRQFTGVSNKTILQNMYWAVLNGIPVIARIPVIPGINDSIEDAVQFCDLLKQIGIHQVNLLPFHQFGQKKYESLQMEYAFKNTKALHPEDLQEYKSIFDSAGFDTKI